jgi:hypothetical protein
MLGNFSRAVCDKDCMKIVRLGVSERCREFDIRGCQRLNARGESIAKSKACLWLGQATQALQNRTKPRGFKSMMKKFLANEGWRGRIQAAH